MRGNVSVVFGLSYRSHCKSHLACFTLDFTTTTTTTPPSTPWPPASPLPHPGDRALVDSLVGFHQQIQLSTRKKYGKYGNSDELILLNNGYSEMILVVVIFHLVWLQVTRTQQVASFHRVASPESSPVMDGFVHPLHYQTVQNVIAEITV